MYVIKMLCKEARDDFWCHKAELARKDYEAADRFHDYYGAYLDVLEKLGYDVAHKNDMFTVTDRRTGEVIYEESIDISYML